MKGSKSKKIAAITGAGRGNGKAIAIELGQRGFALFLSDIKTELLESTILEGFLIQVISKTQINFFNKLLLIMVNWMFSLIMQVLRDRRDFLI